MPTPRKPRPESAARARPVEDNIQAVATLEHEALEGRSRTARISDAIATIAASDASILLHLVWFVAWVVLNSRLSPWSPFDPFPYNILASITSIEAIFLALFVMASQNRLTQESEKRAHLDLQINLLAEKEMTIVLGMLRELCEHAGLTETTRSAEFKALIKDTNVQELADRVTRELGKEKADKEKPVNPKPDKETPDKETPAKR